MTNLDSILKNRDITLPIKVHLVKAMVFLVVMYGCENWTWNNRSLLSHTLCSCGEVRGACLLVQSAMYTLPWCNGRRCAIVSVWHVRKWVRGESDVCECAWVLEEFTEAVMLHINHPKTQLAIANSYFFHSLSASLWESLLQVFHLLWTCGYPRTCSHGKWQECKRRDGNTQCPKAWLGTISIPLPATCHSLAGMSSWSNLASPGWSILCSSSGGWCKVK